MPNPSTPADTAYGLQGLLTLLHGVAEAASFPSNQLVLLEQDRLNTVLLILDGVVKVRSLQSDGSEEVLGILGGGECIGIASVFGADHAWGDVASLTPVRLMRLPKAVVIDLILRQPEAAFHFMAMMGASLRTVRERVLNRHRQPSERVVCTLAELARKAHPNADPTGPWLAPPISQTELAILTGVARETCCRCLNKLQRKGVITRHPEGWELSIGDGTARPAPISANDGQVNDSPANRKPRAGPKSTPPSAGARGGAPSIRSSPPPGLPSPERSRNIVRN